MYVHRLLDFETSLNFFGSANIGNFVDVLESVCWKCRYLNCHRHFKCGLGAACSVLFRKVSGILYILSNHKITVKQELKRRIATSTTAKSEEEFIQNYYIEIYCLLHIKSV